MANHLTQRCCLAICLLSIPSAATGQDFAVQQSRSVTAVSSNDWVYALTGVSSVQPPRELAANYASHKQTYDFFGPIEPIDGVSFPLIIDISPQDRPKGWYYWEPICRNLGIIYATPRGMGNGHPMEHRVRAVLDVLNDVRQQFEIDPKRTYLVGFSGGGQVACQIAFRLPEYFGGVICIGHSPIPPHEPWLRQRWRDKMSLVLIAGEREAAYELNTHLAVPLFEAASIRTESFSIRRRGHVMPESEMLELACDWLEADINHREDVIKAFPAMSFNIPPTREKWASLLKTEAKHRLQDPELLGTGLDQLKWITERWPDLPHATECRTLMDSYNQRDHRPWEAARTTNHLHSLQIEACGLEELTRSPPKVLQGNRRNLHRRAVLKWQEILEQASSQDIADVAREHLQGLQTLTDVEPEITAPLSLHRVRFRMVGTVTLSEGIEYFRRSVEPLGYTIEVDPSIQQVIQLDGDRTYKLNLPTATMSEIKSRFFRRVGVVLKIDKSVIRLTSSKANR